MVAHTTVLKDIILLSVQCNTDEGDLSKRKENMSVYVGIGLSVCCRDDIFTFCASLRIAPGSKAKCTPYTVIVIQCNCPQAK